MMFKLDPIWFVVGLVAQAAFSARFLVQWIPCPNAPGRSLMPIHFWYFQHRRLDAAARVCDPPARCRHRARTGGRPGDLPAQPRNHPPPRARTRHVLPVAVADAREPGARHRLGLGAAAGHACADQCASAVVDGRHDRPVPVHRPLRRAASPERAGRPVNPIHFWYLSMSGSLLLLAWMRCSSATGHHPRPELRRDRLPAQSGADPPAPAGRPSRRGRHRDDYRDRQLDRLSPRRRFLPTPDSAPRPACTGRRHFHREPPMSTAPTAGAPLRTLLHLASWLAVWGPADGGRAVDALSLVPIDETRLRPSPGRCGPRRRLVLHLNGEPASHKPPLLFWLIELSWAVFGIGDAQARLVTALAASPEPAAARRAGRPPVAAGSRSAPLRAPWLLARRPVLRAVRHDADVRPADERLRADRPDRTRRCLALGRAAARLAAVRARPQARRADQRTGRARPPAAAGAALAPSGSSRPAPDWRRWYRALGPSLLGGFALALSWAVPAAIAGGAEYRAAILWGRRPDAWCRPSRISGRSGGICRCCR